MITLENSDTDILPEVKEVFKPGSMIHEYKNNLNSPIKLGIKKNKHISESSRKNEVYEIIDNKVKVKEIFEKNIIKDENSKVLIAYKVVDMIINKNIDKDMQIKALFNLVKFFQSVLAENGIDPLLVMEKIYIFGEDYKEFENMLINEIIKYKNRLDYKNKDKEKGLIEEIKMRKEIINYKKCIKLDINKGKIKYDKKMRKRMKLKKVL